MRVWIEVSGEYLLERKLQGGRGLYAPAGTRYQNMMKEIMPGDIILHYIAASRAINKKLQSVFIGISIADSEYFRDGAKLLLPLRDIKQLPKTVSFSQITEIKNKSEKFKYFLKTNFQKYLGEIEIGDLKKIISLCPENYLFLKEEDNYKTIFK